MIMKRLSHSWNGLKNITIAKWSTAVIAPDGNLMNGIWTVTVQ